MLDCVRKCECAYLRDTVEHDRQEKVGAVCLLSSLSLVLEEWELCFDAVPTGHLVDVVEHDEGVEDEHEVLHAVDGWQEHFLQVLGCLRCLREHDIDGAVVELDRDYEGHDTQCEHYAVLDRLQPDQLYHPFLFLLNYF